MNTRVLIIHQSAIIAEGLMQILQNSTLQLHDHLRSFADPENINIHTGSNYVFITTYGIYRELLKNRLTSIPESSFRLIELVHDEACHHQTSESETIWLHDDQNQIVEKVRAVINSFQPEKNTSLAALTDRETEILKLVALGNANKEMADKLNISTHTVVTHRKNITEKLGIKSISGLTVYAILNKIIDTDELSIDDLI